MAPPDRSRRKRHGKSPRNKRFGSGKSTPSSPAGTPTRHSLSQKGTDATESASALTVPETELKTLSNSDPGESQQPTSTDLSGISVPSEELPKASTSGIGYQNCLPKKVINEEPDSEKIDCQQNLNMSSDGLKKLDQLCGLLENIVIEHKSTVAPSSKHCDSLVEKQVHSEEKVLASQASNNTVSEPSQDKTRDEIELERKLRKEAKKSKKKGGNKENEKDAVKEVNENKQIDLRNASKPAQKPQQALTTSEAQKNSKETQKLQPTHDKKPAEEDASGKSKADLKRERREKQEAQRKAKAEAKLQQETTNKQKEQPQQSSKDKAASQQPKKKTEAEGKQVRDRKSAERGQSERRIPLLDHLMAHASQHPSYPVNCDFIHPAVRTLGIKMKERIIDGSTARVISMLASFRRVISDYQTPESCDLSRDLAEKLLPNVAFLHACRPQNIAMDNAVRFLKHEINSIKPDEPEAQAKDQLRTAIDEYVKNNIILASSTIASHAAQVIQDGDVILTFGYSALVSDVIEAASNRGDKISVVVADSPQPPSGAAMVKRLADLGVATYYRLITEVSHIMSKVTKVIVEAEAVMMNGAVQGLCGTASLALAAANHDTPFIVLCHTYKFCNNDLTDSLVLNELGDADSMVSCPSKDYCNLLQNWREIPNLNVVSLVYDVTPANLVTALITEQNVLPTSAVPVIIRRNYADILGQD